MKKYRSSRSLIATFCIAAILFFPACPAFWQTVKGIARCAPELIAEVAAALTHDRWQEELKARGEQVGIDAITCAVEAVADAGDAPHAGIIRLPLSESRRRAMLWLEAHKRKE